ncbi:hypothetical protein [Nonomuraea sp. NEAU-A123]|uniref:hypothetical protein n=1 Tax=Nonomuraea sp. NEAU-A123 TaxID=2839649 RepID=UPI001BE43C4F|nr:hypothetical protein [Nonomuraea sp. NEAU-A123]MBT2226236.1 hypothetical protein [Nonomuraea sp. NEAU-A123]
MKIYFQHADGRIKTRELVDLEGPPGFGAEVPPPAGFTRITAEEGERLIAEHAAARRRQLDRARADRDVVRLRAYEQLVSLGLDDDLAAFLAGGGPR